MLKKDGYLKPILLQALGIVLLIGFAVYWGVTGHESSLLVGAALVLIGLGSASGSIINVKQEIQAPPEDKHP